MEGESKREKKVECFRYEMFEGMVGMMPRDRINNDVVWFRTGMVKKLGSRVDTLVLRWYGLMVRMDDAKMVKKAFEAEVSGRRSRGRPKFGKVDGVKQALGKRDMWRR